MNSKKMSQKLSFTIAFGVLCFFNTGIVGEASEVVEEVRGEATDEVISLDTNIGITTVLDEYDTKEYESQQNLLVNEDGEIETHLPITEEEYLGTVFTLADDYIYIREEPTEESLWVGKLYNSGAAEAVGTAGEWSLIESGNVTGYVLTEDLVMGEEAEILTEVLAINQVEVTASALNVRSMPTTEAKILDTVPLGTELTMMEEETDGWYTVLYGEEIAYVHGDYVVESDQYSYAESKEEEAERKQEYEEAVAKAEEEAKAAEARSVLGEEIVAYAMQFVGNSYVWGGTSLTNGADCSGFVQSVFANFGISLPRTSSEQRTVGVEVAYADAMPGDIVCYSGHVGIYIGDGVIVNALNSSRGITTINASYNTILSVRRVV